MNDQKWMPRFEIKFFEFNLRAKKPSHRKLHPEKIRKLILKNISVRTEAKCWTRRKWKTKKQSISCSRISIHWSREQKIQTCRHFHTQAEKHFAGFCRFHTFRSLLQFTMMHTKSIRGHSIVYRFLFSRRASHISDAKIWLRCEIQHVKVGVDECILFFASSCVWVYRSNWIIK